MRFASQNLIQFPLMENQRLYMVTVFYIDTRVHTFLFFLLEQILSCMHFNGDVCRLELVLFVLYAKSSFGKAAQWLSALSVVSEACS